MKTLNIKTHYPAIIATILVATAFTAMALTLINCWSVIVETLVR